MVMFSRSTLFCLVLPGCGGVGVGGEGGVSVCEDIEMCLKKAFSTAIPGLSAYLESVLKSTLVEAVRDGRLRKYLENFYGKIGASFVLNTVATILREICPFVSNLTL